MTMTKVVLLLLLLHMLCMTVTRCQQTCTDYGHAMIPDCNCTRGHVEQAVVDYIQPLLAKITQARYFRYFFVDLEKPCPFWHEEAVCMMEACSVYTCDSSELPQSWLQPQNPTESYGWVDSQGGAPYVLDKVTVRVQESDSNGTVTETGREMNRLQRESQGYLQYLHATEDCDTLHDWTTIGEEEGRSIAENGVYVNLLENPERFTGYAGASATRVWQAITEENCFHAPAHKPATNSFGSGTSMHYGSLFMDTPTSTVAVSALEDDSVDRHACLEERVFARVISGLRASITTLLSREYRFSSAQSMAAHHERFAHLVAHVRTPTDPDKLWGPNFEILQERLLSHPERLRHLHFAFLFTLRAVAKARDVLLADESRFDTGDANDDNALRAALHGLLDTLSDSDPVDAVSSSSQEQFVYGAAQTDTALLRHCAHAFDETRLFSAQTLDSLSPAEGLREELRLKFRNISSILDCVTCEKCRLWGKVQVLGLGTAAKVLLHPGGADAGVPRLRLRRQEVVALLNTLHQLSKSVSFVAQTQRLLSLPVSNMPVAAADMREQVSDPEPVEMSETAADSPAQPAAADALVATADPAADSAADSAVDTALDTLADSAADTAADQTADTNTVPSVIELHDHDHVDRSSASEPPPYMHRPSTHERPASAAQCAVADPEKQIKFWAGVALVAVGGAVVLRGLLGYGRDFEDEEMWRQMVDRAK